MQHRQITLFMCVVFFALLSVVRADVTTLEKLSVKEAVGIALQKNVRLQQAKLTTLDTQANLRKSRILMTHAMSVETGTSASPGERYTTGLIGSTTNFTSPLGTTASLLLSPYGLGSKHGSVALQFDQPLTQGRGRFSQKYNDLINAASAVRLQSQSLSDSEQSTTLDVITAYYNAVLARDRTSISEAALKQAQDSNTLLQKKVDAGMLAGIAVTQTEVAVMNAKESLNDAKQSARSAIDSLMLSMGMPVGQVPDLIDDVPNYDPQLPKIEEAIESALANRLDIAQSRESLAQQQRSLAIANDRLRTNLGLTASWTSSSPDAGLLASSLLNQGSSYVGMRATVPIDRRLLKEDKEISARALERMQKDRAYQDEQIANEIRNAYRAVEKARASVANLSENEKIINLQVYQARRMLEEGRGTSTDLVRAQDALASFNVQSKSAKVSLYLAHLQLKRAMGEEILEAGAK